MNVPLQTTIAHKLKIASSYHFFVYSSLNVFDFLVDNEFFFQGLGKPKLAESKNAFFCIIGVTNRLLFGFLLF